MLTGRLEHEELAELLPACEALVVPSTFPEAFGMVAAEAAACGALPVSARHSGLAEVSEALAAGGARAGRGAGCRFPVDDGAVQALAERVVGWLAGRRRSCAARHARGLVEAVRERWSWEGVAAGVIAAAQGVWTAWSCPERALASAAAGAAAARGRSGPPRPSRRRASDSVPPLDELRDALHGRGARWRAPAPAERAGALGAVLAPLAALAAAGCGGQGRATTPT